MLPRGLVGIPPTLMRLASTKRVLALGGGWGRSKRLMVPMRGAMAKERGGSDVTVEGNAATADWGSGSGDDERNELSNSADVMFLLMGASGADEMGSRYSGCQTSAWECPQRSMNRGVVRLPSCQSFRAATVLTCSAADLSDLCTFPCLFLSGT